MLICKAGRFLVLKQQIGALGPLHPVSLSALPSIQNGVPNEKMVSNQGKKVSEMQSIQRGGIWSCDCNHGHRACSKGSRDPVGGPDVPIDPQMPRNDEPSEPCGRESG